MRLWHKDLIDVLPRQQLLAQWRELSSIYAKEDQHILINFIYDYPSSHLYTYSLQVLNEMQKRGYKISQTAQDRFTKYFYDKNCKKISHEKLFNKKMDDRYFIQCYCNLQEKYDCDSIEEKDWLSIENKYINRIWLQKSN